MMLRRLRTKNMIPAKFKNPLYFCYGDSPDKIEMCWTELGAKDKQLLTFFYGQTSRI